METTEKIVESYFRYIKGCFTIPNIKCRGQYEIDLLAIDPKTTPIKKFHVESGVSISGSYSKLTTKPFSTKALKERVAQAGQRRTLGYFKDRKFSAEPIITKLSEYGFSGDNYSKIIVTWDADDDVVLEANSQGIDVIKFKLILNEIAEAFEKDRTYFTDDTLRTLQLFSMSKS